MSDKCSFRKSTSFDSISEEPKTAYEILMEKKKLHPDITMWFTEQHCPECECPVFTNGVLLWCKEGCINNGKRKPEDKDYMKFVKENCR
jgi:hypothetical protein